jgi:excisionase family DNA binding protein
VGERAGSAPTKTEVTMNDNDHRSPDKLLLRPDEVAALLDVPLRTIYRWRSRHDGPRGYRIGRHVRYRVDDIEAWLEDHRDPQ